MHPCPWVGHAIEDTAATLQLHAKTAPSSQRTKLYLQEGRESEVPLPRNWQRIAQKPFRGPQTSTGSNDRVCLCFCLKLERGFFRHMLENVWLIGVCHLYSAAACVSQNDFSQTISGAMYHHCTSSEGSKSLLLARYLDSGHVKATPWQASCERFSGNLCMFKKLEHGGRMIYAAEVVSILFDWIPVSSYWDLAVGSHFLTPYG